MVAGKEVGCYPDQRVVLAPFFGYGYTNPRIANTIAQILNSWGAVIPKSLRPGLHFEELVRKIA